jgi:hypothetical protein
VPVELCDLVDRLLAKQPARRFACAEHVEQELNRLLVRVRQGGLSLRPRGWRAIGSLTRRPRRLASAVADLPRRTRIVLGIATVFSVSLIAWLTTHMLSTPRPPTAADVPTSQAPEDLAARATQSPHHDEMTVGQMRRFLAEYASHQQLDQEFLQNLEQIRVELSRLEQDLAAPLSPAVHHDRFDQETAWIRQQIERLASELDP